MIKIIFIVLSLVSFNAGAQEKVKHGFLSFEPWWIVAKDKTISGIHYDAAKLIYERAGIDVEFSLYPYARLLHVLKNGGTAFITYGDNPAVNRNEVVETCVPGVLVTLSSFSIDKEIPNTMEEYEGRSVIAIRGWPLGPYQPMLENKKIKVNQVGTLTSALNMLKLGRAEFLITTDLPLEIEANKIGFDFQTLTRKEVFRTNGFFASMPLSYKGDRTLCSRVRGAAEELISEGKLDRKTMQVIQ